MKKTTAKIIQISDIIQWNEKKSLNYLLNINAIMCGMKKLKHI